MRVSTMRRGILRLLGLFSPQTREVLEMRYLWDIPHRIDSSKLATRLPDYRATPFYTAISVCLASHVPSDAKGQRVDSP